MNNMFERMKGLLSASGISFDNNSYSKAEIFAYASGMEFVKNYFDNILKKVFINLDDAGDMYEYTQILNIIKSDFTTEKLKECIYTRLGMPFGDYSKSNFKNAFNGIGSGTYQITNDKIIFSNIAAEDLHKLGSFIKSYVFLMKDFSYDGSGLTFDEKDACNMNFHDCDKLNLPFDIIDTLRRSTNE